MTRSFPLIAIGFAGAVALVGFGSASARAAENAKPTILFNRDVRPILSDNCYACHGPDDKKRKGGVHLNTFEGATAEKDGRRALVPGDPATSELVKRVLTADEDDLMPPADSGKKLTPQQKQILKAWVEQGGKYQKHWAFEPVAKVDAPATKSANWARNPIDSFILAGLEAKNLAPSPEAEKSTLIRRASLDLVGLPPTPAEVDAFVKDASPDAYEKVIDRLLASKHYGERWGRHWLDQARYADSHGYSIDAPRQMWLYRDWAIDAVNADMPFDRFTVEQLAGDLLDKPTQSQLIATGFHRNTMINQEGGSDAEQFRVEAAVDRVSTTGSVWLGLTVGCAQCHTHKFDPITHKEFHQLYAFFNSDADRNSVEPSLKMPTEEQKRKLDALKKELAEAKKGSGAKPVARAGGAKPQAAAAVVKWTVATPQALTAKSGATLTRLPDDSVLAGGKPPEDEHYTVTVKAPLKTITAIRLEALTDDSLPKKGPGRASNGNFVLHEVKLVDINANVHDFADASADVEQDKYPADAAVDKDLTTGWAINPGKAGGPLNVNRTLVLTLAAPLKIVADEGFHIELSCAQKSYALGRFRISVTEDAPANAPAVASATGNSAKPVDPSPAKHVKDLEQQIKSLEASIGSALVMKRLPEPRPTNIMIRGDFLRKGDPVRPGTLAVLNPFKPRAQAPADQSAIRNPKSEIVPDRLDLARWLVDPANPLTPRVAVNRVWMRYFGAGLVETENDFGTQGTQPTHPELLDFLAGRFVEGGWSLKKLHKLIVTSATYRQASAGRPDLAAADPLNKLLGRQNRLRVEAEIVRDLALAASGLLTDKVGGPSVYPPQPDGVYAFTQVKKVWPTSTGPDRYRRGLYTFVFRSAPYPQLTTFDVPRPDVTCTRRLRSNTPLQSLTQANGAATFEMAQALATRVLAGAKDDAARLALAYKLCLSRDPSADEAATLAAFLGTQRREFGSEPEAAKKVAPAKLPAGVSPADAAAWTAVARVLLNVDEFITRE
ncbi:MAG: PSD1 and planctomycete cytochrome C domain-containing protein [Phycisphaerae bacterium]